jgi:prolyl oligopeptidase
VTGYPEAIRQDVADELHGVRVPDPYRWLEDAESPMTRDWLARQDALWRAAVPGLAGRDWFRDRGAELAGIGMVTPPVWRGERCFVLRREGGAEHAVVCLGDRVLVDPMALDPGGLTVLDAWHVDHEGRRLAYQVSRAGTERSELSVLDVETGETIDGPIDGCRYSPVAWLPGGDAFFYVRERAVRRHTVGAPVSDDLEVLPATGTVSYGLEISADGRWLTVSAAAGTAPRNDLYLADLAHGTRLVPVQQGIDARSAFVVGRDGMMYIVTDRGAPRIRLCVAEPARPGDWRELVPEDPGAVLTGFALLDGDELEQPVVLVSRLRDGTAEITVHDRGTGKRVGEVALPGAGSVAALSTRPENACEAWFVYTDTVTPGAVWRYDHRIGETSPWQTPPGVTDLPEVEVTREECVSADGTPVRITIVGPRGGKRPRPTILHAYGGFGLPLTAKFAADALMWVEAGGALAIAHVRGGGEQGRISRGAGMGEHRERVVEDLLAAAGWLVDSGRAGPDGLGLWGESSGGLLAAGALTRRPDLFGAAVCVSPLTDMVRYERSGLGPLWTEEYGSAADPGQFRRLLAGSPYHSVSKRADYPATLFAVFDGDSRVPPLHARKMCAALQWATGGGRPILLRAETSAGHGDRSVSRSLELTADLLAFLATHTGLRLPNVR